MVFLFLLSFAERNETVNEEDGRLAPTSIRRNDVIEIPGQKGEEDSICVEDKHGSEVRVSGVGVPCEEFSCGRNSEVAHPVVMGPRIPGMFLNVVVISAVHCDICENLHLGRGTFV